MRHLILWLAQGFGAGRLPGGPGTCGTLVGLPVFALLIFPGSLWVYVGGIVLLTSLAVWLAGQAEDILKQTDPSSVVVDEIAAVPVCFLGWFLMHWSKSSSPPSPTYFFEGESTLGTVAVLVAFRFFDIFKPWPVRQVQGLPRGWGVTADDILAAGYVNVLVLAFYWIQATLAG